MARFHCYCNPLFSSFLLVRSTVVQKILPLDYHIVRFLFLTYIIFKLNSSNSFLLAYICNYLLL